MKTNRIFRHFAGLLLAGGLFLTSLDTTAQTAARRDVLREITDVVGLKPRFELRSTSEVQNAAAVVYNGQRYLLYNSQFVGAVNQAGHTDWAGISILAHEMGHHLNGHTLRAGGSNPNDELEADEFSGFVLRKMGASLAQAQAAMAVIADDQASATHPGRPTRLKAISEGWQRANGQIVASAKATAPSAAPAVLTQRTPPATPVRTVSSAISVIGKITFRSNPGEQYYLTDRLSVVRLARNSRAAEVVGKLSRSGNRDFPYILTDGQQRRLYVSADGDVYNPDGEPVGRLSDPS